MAIIELWDDLPGYSRYSITDLGRIINNRTEKEVKGTMSGGYLMVTLYSDDGKKRMFRKHRVIATVFCDNPEGKSVVNHIDGNKTNNEACNLEWVTSRENTRHARDIGLIKDNNSRKIVRIDLESKEEVIFSSMNDACDQTPSVKYASYISAVCSGRQRSVGGYFWKHFEETKKEEVPDGETVDGFSNYIVTRDGKVYSKTSHKFLKPRKISSGYLVVDLQGDNYSDKDIEKYTRKRSAKRKKFRVHRLVAMCYIQNPNLEVYTEVNHKDKDRTNNNVENLEWVTSKQNLQHAHCKRVAQYNFNGSLIREFESLTIASETTGVGYDNISSCLRKTLKGKEASAGGYKWSYV